MNNQFLLNLRLNNLERQLDNLIELYGRNQTSLPKAPSTEEQATEQAKCEILGVKLNKVGGMWLSEDVLNAEPHLGDEEHYNGICPKLDKYLMYITLKEKTCNRYTRFLATCSTTVCRKDVVSLKGDNFLRLEIQGLVDCEKFEPAKIVLCCDQDEKEDISFINDLVGYMRTISVGIGRPWDEFFGKKDDKYLFRTMAFTSCSDNVSVDVFSSLYKPDTVEEITHDFCLESNQMLYIYAEKE